MSENERTHILNYHIYFFTVWQGEIKRQAEKAFSAPANSRLLVDTLQRKDLKKFSALVMIEGAVSKSYSVLSPACKTALLNLTELQVVDLIKNVESLIDIKAAGFLAHLKRTFPDV